MAAVIPAKQTTVPKLATRSSPACPSRATRAGLPPWLVELLKRAEQQLTQLYGERLHGLYLYGSYSRGTARPDSDVDLAIVLDEVPQYDQEIDRTSELIAELARAYDVSVSRVFLSQRQWSSGEGPFLTNARRHAVAA